jgi:hypothetical protein
LPAQGQPEIGTEPIAQEQPQQVTETTTAKGTESLPGKPVVPAPQPAESAPEQPVLPVQDQPEVGAEVTVTEGPAETTAAEVAEPQPEEPAPPAPQQPQQPPVKTGPAQTEQPGVADANQAASPLYRQLAELLRSYVDARGLVNYELLRRRRGELAVVLREFAGINFKQYDSWGQAEKMAFWINAYNACTLKVVVDNYPIQASRYKMFWYPAGSIMHISNPWTGYNFDIMGESYNLQEIQRGILLRQFSDPRICFALSYASLDGPVLLNEPYTGARLDEQLQRQAQRFISSRRGFKIDRDEKAVYLSAIFKDSWYGRCFLGKYGTDEQFREKDAAERAVLNFITQYLPRRDRDLLVRKDYSIKYIKFDWTLNEQR